MFTKTAKLCILMFVTMPFFSFAADPAAPAATATAAINANAYVATTTPATEIVTEPSKTTTTTASATKNEITTALVYAATITNDLKVDVVEKKKRADIRRILQQQNNVTAANAAAIRVKTEMAGAAETSATSTATPTTTATTSTTTTRAPEVQEQQEQRQQQQKQKQKVEQQQELEQLAHIWRQRLAEVSKNGNGASSQISMLKKSKEKFETELKKITTEAAYEATPEKQEVVASTTQLIKTELNATEMPVTVQVETETITAAGENIDDVANLVKSISTAPVIETVTEVKVKDAVVPETTTNNLIVTAAAASKAAASAMQIEAKAYQIQETLRTEPKDEEFADENLTSKLNIVDLYPFKMEDFKPIIREANERLLHERTIFQQPTNAAEFRQILIPNEVDLMPEVEKTKTLATLVNRGTVTTATTATSSARQLPDAAITGETIGDFNGQNGVITEIEQKFHLNDFQTSSINDEIPVHTIKAATTAAKTKTTAPISGIQTFVDRRIKKSFEFPIHRIASDAMSMPHIDFANTKFNGDADGIGIAGNVGGGSRGSGGDGEPNKSTAAFKSVPAAHPEFSTTKFYNSKELHNEMLLHNKRKLMNQGVIKTMTTTSNDYGNILKSTLSTMSLPANTTKLKTDGGQTKFVQNTTTAMPATAASVSRVTITATMPATVATAAATTTGSKTFSTTNTLPTLTTTAMKPKKYRKELKRAKLLLKAMLPTMASAVKPTAATVTARETEMNFSKLGEKTFKSTKPAPETTKITYTDTSSSSSTSPSTATTITTLTTMSIATPKTMSSSWLPLSTVVGKPSASQHHRVNPSKSASKPIARPRILSRLQEKINSLECEIQNVPQDSHLWRGNETHELLLPIVTTEHCRMANDCTPNVVSWEGEAEIQSGDILIVEINDAMLKPHEFNNTTSAHATQVYQVTRSGHEHCDVTEGILLDITPLVVDGRKLVTLYDKDLTEGVNLLIVVSELWDTQCVRLKVTTKTDNCGENADCSGKGVCYSSLAMEEYECQCCTGFAGPHCEEIDACNPSPCTNNGICVDLSQGHEGNSYQCLCPYGYTGKNCQYESDPCNPAECLNGGSCMGNSTHFRCDCTPGYTGPLCQHSLNECESSPCVHGICVDQEDGFRCFCQPGFAGELCNFEYNECESNPCQNGGECIDHIGSYECRCTKGYTGNRCQIKVDFCANKPCPEGEHCIDHGNDFSCECLGGRNGPDCNQMPRTQCNVNPCTHGGTCWSSGDSFYCACRPGYTGTMCEDEFVVETVVSSSEFIVDDTSARNFNDKTFGSSVVLKSPIELHNAYFAAGVLAAAIFIVAVVVTICHCKVNQTYRKFSTRSTSFFPILGFSRRPKLQNKLKKHWLSGKGLTGAANSLRSTSSSSTRHLPQSNGSGSGNGGGCGSVGASTHASGTAAATRQLHERPFQRHLAMNLENDMYYTVDFSENSQHSPLIQ